MKFGQALKIRARNSPAEWGPFWLNYKLLKKKIKGITSAEKDHKPSPTTPEALSSCRCEVEFFRLMDYEIRRGAQFLSLTEEQYVLRTRSVVDGYRSTQHLLQSPMLGLDRMLSPEATAEMWTRLMQACISVYTELLLLNHWVVVSYCGFSKILKKHDRWTGFMTKEKYLRCVVAKQHFTSFPKLHAMLKDMEALYLHIAKHVQDCPGLSEGEAKMAAVKEMVASDALEFAKYTTELRRSIHGEGSANSGSSLVEHGDEDEEPDSSTDAGERTPPVCSTRGGAEQDTGKVAEAEELSMPMGENVDPKKKRRKLSGEPFACSTAEQHRAEVGQLHTGASCRGDNAEAATQGDIAIDSDSVRRLEGRIDEGGAVRVGVEDVSGEGGLAASGAAVVAELEGKLAEAGENIRCDAGPASSAFVGASDVER